MNSIESPLSELTIEQKASLCSGLDFWRTKPVEAAGISSIMLTDGPHGIRKQESEIGSRGLGESRKATCFPPACTSSSSFDVDLLAEIGEAIGEEARDQEVSVVLGPAANIKRSPLCGRNFEYISEDPYITGEMAAAFIRGVQSKGVGTSLKHFAANNQEAGRLICDAIIDERALREIYLAGFEAAVKKSAPWTLMCSYNMINGEYSCENKRLLSDILRQEWGYNGLVMTDWAAMNERVKALSAGLELEMPGPAGENDALIVKAVQSGELPMEVLDTAVRRILQMVNKSKARTRPDSSPYEKSREVARKAFLESAVLLKNEGILPLNKTANIAVIGAFAKETRFQGSGSSFINTDHVTSALEGFTAAAAKYEYAEGYSLEGGEPDTAKIATALDAAKGKDAVIIFAGLPDEYESEGFDRTHMDLPDSHNRLIEEVIAVNPNVVVVLYTGSPVAMPWIGKVRAVLLAYLPGQEGAGAIPDLLYGDAVPCGKLAETFPLRLEDTPCFRYYGQKRNAEYRESIFVGYRYYDAAKAAVLFPFGHGLSYAKFEYGKLKLSGSEISDQDTLTISLDVKNTGNFDGKEVVELYVSAPKSLIFKPEQELKAFAKVFVRKGETANVTLSLDRRAFAFYNVNASDWQVESGEYKIRVGSSSRDIRQVATVYVSVDENSPVVPDYSKSAPVYYFTGGEGIAISQNEFEAVYGSALRLHEMPRKGNHSLNSTTSDLMDSWIGRRYNGFVQKEMRKQYKIEPRKDQIRMMAAMMEDYPLRGFVSSSNGLVSRALLEGMLVMINGRVIKGALQTFRAWRALRKKNSAATPKN